MAVSNTFTGARAVFYIGATPVAFAGGMSGEELIDYEPIDVLGLLEVREHVPVAYRVSLSAQIFRVIGDSLKAQSIMPRQDDILTTDTLTAAVKNEGKGKYGSQSKLPNATVQLFQEVHCSGHTFDITARGVVQENVSFVAIRTTDESEPNG